LAACLLLLPSLSPGRDLCDAWMHEVEYALTLNLPYVWGGDSYRGADCSGILFQTARRAGAPVMRTTAARMASGSGGWGGSESASQMDCDRCVLVCMTTKPARPLGHIGVGIGCNEFAHASLSRGFVRQPLEGIYRGYLRLLVRPEWASPRD